MIISRTSLQALVDLLDHECLGYTDEAADASKLLGAFRTALSQTTQDEFTLEPRLPATEALFLDDADIPF